MNKKLYVGLILFFLQAGSMIIGSDLTIDPVVKALAVRNKSRLDRAVLHTRNQIETKMTEHDSCYYAIANELRGNVYIITGQNILIDPVPQEDSLTKRIELSPDSVLDPKFSPKEISEKKSVSMTLQNQLLKKSSMNKDCCVQYCTKVENYFKHVEPSKFSLLVKVK